MVEPETYLHYIHTRVSRPSANEWVTYGDASVQSVLDDFKRLWATGFLDDLSIEAVDYPFDNGVVGKMIVYHMEERQRIKIVTYEGMKHLEQSKLEERLRELDLMVRIDTFVDQTRLKRIRTTIIEMLAELGFPDASVTPELRPLPGGPKLANLTFSVAEGPQTKIRRIEFQGNTAYSDGKLESAMKQNQSKRWFPIPRFSSTYKQGGFEEDAERIVSFYRDSRLSGCARRPAIDTHARRFRRWRHTMGGAGDPRHRGRAVPRWRVHGRGRDVGPHRLSRVVVQSPARRAVQRERDSRRAEQGARALRRTRTVRIYGVSRPRPQGRWSGKVPS